MPSFPKPSFTFQYQTDTEIQRLRHYRDNEPGRQIPAKSNNRLFVGTWNIANLGQQQRTDKDYRILAEIISWFDIIALGDFNLPKVEPDDLIYTALRKRGFERPTHSPRIASSIASDSDYDQIMFFPGQTDDEFTGNIGVFDFDGAIFASL